MAVWSHRFDDLAWKLLAISQIELWCQTTILRGPLQIKVLDCNFVEQLL